MDEEARKIIAEQMKNLPKDVVASIASANYKIKLQEITQRQNLLIDQAGALEMETSLVMIGLEPLADYIDNLERELGVTLVRAKEIAADVNKNIFQTIRDSLQIMNDETSAPATDKESKEGYLGWGNVENGGEETDLNRDQVLNEIENPEMIKDGNQSMNFKKETPKQAESTAIEIRPVQEIKTIPGQEVKDVARSTDTDILTTKMTSSTTISQQVINTKPESKLPEIKKRPTNEVDPYREQI
ncbi:MAG: hypothetical protein WCP24_00940 [bacterium]